VILNQSAVKTAGWTDGTGKKIYFAHDDRPLNVVGVVGDIHLGSLKHNIEPVVYRYADSDWLIAFLTLRINPLRIPETIQFLKDQWKQLGTDAPFEYLFIKDKYLEQYNSEERVSDIIGTFAILTILLACLGLFGLTAFVTQNLTKEIGIRKINGATTANIMLLVIKEFAWLVAIAFLIACPVAFYALNKWLQNFAYKTDLQWWIFIVAGIATLVVALLTVSWQSWVAASRNPAESLRYE
jgi:putative ABC transport system permease protein